MAARRVALYGSPFSSYRMYLPISLIVSVRLSSPSISPAKPVTILKIEPGASLGGHGFISKRSSVFRGLPKQVLVLFVSQALINQLGSNLGFEAKASTSPELTSKTTMAPVSAVFISS